MDGIRGRRAPPNGAAGSAVGGDVDRTVVSAGGASSPFTGGPAADLAAASAVRVERALQSEFLLGELGDLAV